MLKMRLSSLAVGALVSILVTSWGLAPTKPCILGL